MAESTKYLKKVTRYILSENADYTSPILPGREFVEEYTCTRYKKQAYLAATGGTTIDLSEFSTIEDLTVRNLDETNYVDTTHRTAAGSTTDQSTRVDAGKSVSLGDVTPGSDLVLTANGADCAVEVEVFGS